MKFSESWLREWVNPDIDSNELIHRLTMAGLEVDAVEPAASSFNGVVVGEVLQVEPHPNADKLTLCRVRGDSDEPVQVICGAPNARPGIKVPFATVGAVLPDDFAIKRAKLRGVESHGMLCAAPELGLGDDDSGLWELPGNAPVGGDLREFLTLDDRIIEVDLTPNRGDCLSIKGLAREVGALCQVDVHGPAIEPVPAALDDAQAISLEAAEQCPRYVGRVIRDVDVTVESPLWLRERLRRSGIRSIDPVVDVTNYVLLELGQPLHAFDLARLEGTIRVRQAGEGESLTLLDGDERQLDAGTLVIADDRGPLAMAGVMGGESSAVGPRTRDIFLESAFFSPLAITGRARHYGLHTESSHRYERGVDPRVCMEAAERATRLLLDIVGGRPGPLVIEELPEHLSTEITVTLRRQRLDQQLACHLEENEVQSILQRLGLSVRDANPESWTLAVPSWRFDITLEADLVEEVARVHGYNNLPTSTRAAPLSIEPRPEGQLSRGFLGRLLVERGFREVITYSFVDPRLQARIDPDTRGVEVANPIASDMAVMRTSLWPGLLDTLTRNIARQQHRARLFETGLRFLPGDDALNQESMLAGLIYGQRETENWNHERTEVDFFDLKGHVEALVDATRSADEFRYEPGRHPALHPGQTAALYRQDALAGYLGRLHPELQRQLDLDHPVYLFELRSELLQKAAVPGFRPLSRYPSVRRDIAVLVDREVPVESLISTARHAAGELLEDLRIFDVYQGKGVENTKKSVGMGLTYQAQSRTLNESEVAASVDAVVASLEKEFQATLRG